MTDSKEDISRSLTIRAKMELLAEFLEIQSNERREGTERKTRELFHMNIKWKLRLS